MSKWRHLFIQGNRQVNRKKHGDSTVYKAEGMLVHMVLSNAQHVCVCTHTHTNSLTETRHLLL